MRHNEWYLSGRTWSCGNGRECLSWAGKRLVLTRNLERTTTGQRWVEGGYLDLVSSYIPRLGSIHWIKPFDDDADATKSRGEGSGL